MNAQVMADSHQPRERCCEGRSITLAGQVDGRKVL